MAFTDRYIKLPTKIVSIKEADLMGEDNANHHETDIWFNPMDICSFRPGMDDDIERGNTVVDFKNGEGCLVLMAVPEFMQRINEFMK